MSERKRKSINADFKAKVALEAIHGVKTLNQTGAEIIKRSLNEDDYSKRCNS